MKTPASFVSRTRPTGFHTFLWSTSSWYGFRPRRPPRTWPQSSVWKPRSPHLGERQLERLQRGLRPVVREDEPGLEAAEHRLVAVEVLDQHRHPWQPPRAHRREAEQRRLPLRRNAEERVRWVRLVAVLGEPDRLRPERAPDEDQELRDRRHRDRGAVLAAAARRRLARRQRVRMVGVGVELRVGGGHAMDPGDGRNTSQTAARRRHAAADLGVRQHGMDRLVPGVEQMLDVDRRLRRPEPERMVRLVPDQPVPNPGITPRGRSREGAEVTRPRRREVRPALRRSPTPACRPA